MASLELKVDEGVLNFTSSNFIGIGGLSGILGSVLLVLYLRAYSSSEDNLKYQSIANESSQSQNVHL